MSGCTRSIEGAFSPFPGVVANNKENLEIRSASFGTEGVHAIKIARLFTGRLAGNSRIVSSLLNIIAAGAHLANIRLEAHSVAIVIQNKARL